MLTRRLSLAFFFVLAVVSNTNAQALPDGDYFVVAKHSSKALTAFPEASKTTTLGQSSRLKTDISSQIWTITRTAAGPKGIAYNIQSKRDATFLAEGTENANGDIAAVLKNKPMPHGWRLVKHPGGFGIEVAQSGLTLNVTGADERDDAKIIVYDASTDDNAIWNLFPVSGGNEQASYTPTASHLNNADKTYLISALPAASSEESRTLRMKLMDYQPSGLFVRKGEKLSVSVAGLTDSPDGLSIMIGARNSYADYHEANDPQIIATQEGSTQFTAKRNGLMYFLYTDSGFNDAPLPPVSVKITKGGSPIPLFIDGETREKEWQQQLNDYNRAPFVELVNDKAIITSTRSSYLRNAKSKPSELLQIIKNITHWYDAFSGFDGTSPRDMPSPLRLHYLEDTVSSEDALDGIYMYATDYFVGVPSDAMSDLLNSTRLAHAWSIWHETGHKYQQTDWSWDQVVETTVNLYSLNAQAHLGYSTRLKERDPATHLSPYDLASRYLARKARNFTNSKQMRATADDDSDLWVRLVMFDQLRQAFGDDFYPELHRYYRSHPLSGDILRDADAELQEFVVRSSVVAQHDLTQFYADWGVKLDRSTAARLSKLGLSATNGGISALGLAN